MIRILLIAAVLAVPVQAQQYRITSKIGDTLSVSPAIPKLDTALAITGARFVCRKPGLSLIRVAVNRRTKTGTELAFAFFPVACGVPWPVPDTTKNADNPQCNPFADSLVSPCLVDLMKSIPDWKTGHPCAWSRMNDSTLVCSPLPVIKPELSATDRNLWRSPLR